MNISEAFDKIFGTVKNEIKKYFDQLEEVRLCIVKWEGSCSSSDIAASVDRVITNWHKRACAAEKALEDEFFHNKTLSMSIGPMRPHENFRAQVKRLVNEKEAAEEKLKVYEDLFKALDILTEVKEPNIQLLKK